MSATRPAAPHTRWRRLGLLALLAFLGLLVLSLLAAPAVVRRAAERGIKDAGFTEARITGVRLAPNGLRIARIELVPDNRFFLDDIHIRLSWESLRAGEAEKITIDSARIEAELSASGKLDLPGFQPPKPAVSGPAEATREPPLRTATLKSGSLELATPRGPLSISINDAQATVSGAQIALQGGVIAEHASANLSATLAADAALDRESYAARLEIISGKLTDSGLIVQDLDGTVSVSMEAAMPPQAALLLESKKVAYRDLVIGPAGLSAEFSGLDLTYRLSSPADGAAAIDLAGQASLEARRGHVSGKIDIPSLAAVPGSILDGRLRLNADLDVRMQPGGPQASGRLDLVAENLAQPDSFEQGKLELAARIAADPERLTLTSEAPWRVQAHPVAHVLPATLEAYAGTLVELRLTPPEDGAAMTFELDLQQRTAILRTAMTARAADSRLQAMGELRLASAEPGLTIEARPLALSATDLRWETLTLGVERFSGEAGLSAGGRFDITGTGELKVEGEIAALGLEGGEISWSGRIAGNGEELRIDPDRCLKLHVRSVIIDGLRMEAADPPCLAPQEGTALLRYDRAESATDVSVQGEPKPLDIAVVDGEELHRLTGRWPAFSLTAQLGTEGPETVSAEFGGGTLQLAGQPYRVDGLAGTLKMAAGRIESATYKVREFSSLAEPALFAPLGLEATVKRDGNALSLDAFLSDAMGLFVFEAAGQATGESGTLDLTLYPLRFIPEATEPGDLSPALGALVSDMRGPLAVAGRLSWDTDGFASSGQLELGPLSFNVAGLQLNGLEGSIAFDSLLPPSTAGPQELRLNAANIGLLLSNGRLLFDLRPGGQISIEDMRFDLAGGRLSADPFILDLSRAGNTAVMMRADNVDLSGMIMLSGIDGLQGEGTLTGRLPLQLTSEGLTVADGVLEAAGEGVLRYVPGELPAFLKGDDLRSRMLREALQNFQYDALSLTLSGDVGAEQRIALSASGNNPDFLEGHPVELNVTVAGPLVSVVQSAVGGTGAKALERMFRNVEESPDAASPEQEERP